MAELSNLLLLLFLSSFCNKIMLGRFVKTTTEMQITKKKKPKTK